MKRFKQFCKRCFYLSSYGGRLTRLEALGAALWFYRCLRREQANKLTPAPHRGDYLNRGDHFNHEKEH